ncbi:uncharacterized protein LOC135476962 [Liolophura sinensis]|uniref:uncharacterized protein LOC135476962 n=1 Tax=Liolophura sinensis TaxID=3198878 RepID=UPI003158DA8B
MHSKEYESDFDRSFQIQPCPVGEPVASCSAPIRRPKRTALDAGCETPSKVYITEEKMMASMQELSLNHSESSDKALVHNSNNTTTSTTALTPMQSSVERSWQKFRELEDMLADEQIDTELTEVKNTGFKVHINTSVANSIICSSIPKAVLENINKPCLQVVLWKPPVDKLREIVSENVHKNRQKNNSSKQKSSGQSGMRSPTSRTSTATPTCAIDNRQQPDVTALSSMDCEEEDSAMEL